MLMREDCFGLEEEFEEGSFESGRRWEPVVRDLLYLLKRERTCEGKVPEKRGRMTGRQPETMPRPISTAIQMPRSMAVSDD